jgi:hypothetical protein
VNKHKLYIRANGKILFRNTFAPFTTNFWIGQQMSFDVGIVPTIDGTINQSIWTLPQTFVNKSEVYGDPDNGCTHYVVDANLLDQNETSAWWLTDGVKRIGCNLWLTFTNGQKTYVSVRGKLLMKKPELLDKNMCDDKNVYPLAFPTPCLYVSNYSGKVQLGKMRSIPGGAIADDGGYARFWASYRSRLGDQFGYTQISRGFRSVDGVPVIDTGTEWWKDGVIFRNKFLAGFIADTNGVGVVQQRDSPKQPLAQAAASADASDGFRCYIQFRPQPTETSITVTLGRVDWSWGFSAQSTNGQWNITPANLSTPVWNEDSSIPLWDGIIPDQTDP